MKEEMKKPDRYLSFVGIEGERKAQELMALALLEEIEAESC